MSTQNMQMVLQALKNAGLNDNQARILGAEIGRENGFQSRYLWGYHSDPANKAKNIGLISWQGSRATALEKRLAQAGILKNGKMVQSQEALDVQAKFLVDEIRNNSAYAETRKKFLENPNVDYATGTRVLGRNFIRWAYDNPKYASGHKARDKYYQQLGGVVASGGSDTMTASNTAQPPQAQTPTVSTPTISIPTISTPTISTPTTPDPFAAINTMVSATPTGPTGPTGSLMGGTMGNLFGSMPTNANGQDLSDLLVGTSLMRV